MPNLRPELASFGASPRPELASLGHSYSRGWLRSVLSGPALASFGASHFAAALLHLDARLHADYLLIAARCLRSGGRSRPALASIGASGLTSSLAATNSGLSHYFTLSLIPCQLPGIPSFFSRRDRDRRCDREIEIDRRRGRKQTAQIGSAGTIYLHICGCEWSKVDSRDRYLGGLGNCTRVPVYVTVFPKCGYDTSLGGWLELGREAEALREVVSVRAAIIDLIR